MPVAALLTRWSLIVILLVPAVPSAATAAQDPADSPPDVRQPIGRFAADVRASMPRFKQTRAIGDVIGVEHTDLPSRGLGLVLGGHVYPARIGRVTLGLGGEVMASWGSRTEQTDDEMETDGPTVKTRFSAFSPQISLNFGAREGWSYISGGLGWSRFSVELAEDGAGAPAADVKADPRRKTINYGGGARWFATEHVAVSIDVRFYAVSPQLATTTRPALPRMTVMVLSLGAGFK